VAIPSSKAHNARWQVRTATLLWTSTETVSQVIEFVATRLLISHQLQIDVFLLCDDGHGGNTYQIWVNNKADGFSLALQGSMPSGVQSVSFADVGTFHH
jgi:hypothetical protein